MAVKSKQNPVPPQHKPLGLPECQDFMSLSFDHYWGKISTNSCSLLLFMRFSLKTFFDIREFSKVSDQPKSFLIFQPENQHIFFGDFFRSVNLLWVELNYFNSQCFKEIILSTIYNHFQFFSKLDDSESSFYCL